MLFLRSIPLSFSILRRFLWVLPFWVLFYGALTLFAVIAILELVPEIPLFGGLLLILVPILAIMASYVILLHPYMIGIHIGLRLLGVETKPSRGRFVLAAFGYGLFEAAVALLLGALFATAVFVVVLGDFIIFTPREVPWITSPTVEMARQLGAPTLAILPIANSLIVMVLRAALLPVLAGVVVGRDVTGGSHTPFSGFGALFFNMTLVMVLTTATWMVVLPSLGMAAAHAGLSQVLTSDLSGLILIAFGENALAFSGLDAFFVAIAIAVSIWAICLQSAAAALSFQCRAARSALPEVATPPGADRLGDRFRSRRRASSDEGPPHAG